MKRQGAFIGFGNIAELGHWPAYRASREAEIVAIMEPAAARKEAARRLDPRLKIYDTLSALLSQEKLDFVDICTPPSSHAPIALEALAGACHVLCEKPLTLKSSEIQALERAARLAGKSLFTVHNWKYAPIFQEAFARIREGSLGRIRQAEISVYRNNVCQGTQGAAQDGDWRKNAAVAGGGILVDHGWHAFYLLLQMMETAPQSVRARLLRNPADPQGLEEEALVWIGFPEATGAVHLTWRAEARRNRAIAQGGSGMLVVDDDQLAVLRAGEACQTKRFPQALSAGSHHADWFTAILTDFLAGMKDPSLAAKNLEEASWCAALTEAAYRSDAEGGRETAVVSPLQTAAPVTA